MNQVLVVDDEAAIREGLAINFRKREWEVETASGVEEAMFKFRNRRHPLVITDMRMPDGDGLGVLRRVRDIAPETAVILLTAYGSVPEAVSTLQSGACDYFVKPVPFEQLAQAAEKMLGRPNSAPSDTASLVNGSARMKRLVDRALQVARTEADVLIQAESGTGKELMARLIHDDGPRRRGQFVPINCSAFPDGLLESELFGHVRGAFTGAVSNKQGKFELANGGTILLDEIGEMPLHLQPKLLRILQERRLDRLGDTRSINCDVRVIATTNRCLRTMVKEGAFRADLYYRLNVVPLSIPALRERKEDIPELVTHFLAKHKTPATTGRRFSDELMSELSNHDWPGNVRELENFVRRALALSTAAVIGDEDLEDSPFESDHAAQKNNEVTAGRSLQELEKSLLEVTLAATGGNRNRTAEMMGVSVRTVRNKIREHNLAPRYA